MEAAELLEALAVWLAGGGQGAETGNQRGSAATGVGYVISQGTQPEGAWSGTGAAP